MLTIATDSKNGFTLFYSELLIIAQSRSIEGLRDEKRLLEKTNPVCSKQLCPASALVSFWLSVSRCVCVISSGDQRALTDGETEN